MPYVFFCPLSDRHVLEYRAKNCAEKCGRHIIFKIIDAPDNEKWKEKNENKCERTGQGRM